MGRNSPARDYLGQATQDIHPMDVIEQVSSTRDWPCERESDDSLTLFCGGRWTDFRFGFNYVTDCEAVQLTMMFEPKVPEQRQAEVLRLLALINARNWLGHFDWWAEERAVMFRYGLPLREAYLTAGQCEDMIDLALEACDIFFPALQYVLWAGMAADAAIEACVMETQGEA